MIKIEKKNAPVYMFHKKEDATSFALWLYRNNLSYEPMLTKCVITDKNESTSSKCEAYLKEQNITYWKNQINQD